MVSGLQRKPNCQLAVDQIWWFSRQEDLNRNNRCSVFVGYGMTETTVACIYNAPKYPLKAGSVGTVMTNTEAKVIDWNVSFASFHLSLSFITLPSSSSSYLHLHRRLTYIHSFISFTKYIHRQKIDVIVNILPSSSSFTCIVIILPSSSSSYFNRHS